MVNDAEKLVMAGDLFDVPEDKNVEVIMHKPVEIDSTLLSDGIKKAVDKIRDSLGARTSAWTTVVETVVAAKLMDPEVPEPKARDAMIDVGNQIQWYTKAEADTIAALTSSTWRTIQSDVLLAKHYDIPLVRIDEDGTSVVRGKTSVERDIKAAKAVFKAQEGSTAVTALHDLNTKVSTAMVAAAKYTTALNDGAISEWKEEAESFIAASNRATDESKEHMVRQAANSGEVIAKELATTVAAVDLIRTNLVRTLSEFRGVSDAAQIRSKIFASSWEDKNTDEICVDAVTEAAPVDQWEETGEE